MKFSNRVYDILKWVGLIALPALATLLLALGKIWGLPLLVPTAATVTAVGTLVGTLIGVSTTAHNATETEAD